MQGTIQWLGRCAFCLMIVSGCAQPFSDLQSARLAGEGEIEVTGHYSSVSFDNEGTSEKMQDNLGLQLATGIADRTDLRFRYERIDVENADSGVNVIGFGPKFGIVDDMFSIFLPLGFAFGDDIDVSETWEAHPTVLLTGASNKYIELNGSGKLLVPLSADDGDALVAFNIGLGLSSNLATWALRPEFGMMFNPGEDGHFRHFSLGLTVYPTAMD